MFTTGRQGGVDKVDRPMFRLLCEKQGFFTCHIFTFLLSFFGFDNFLFLTRNTWQSPACSSPGIAMTPLANDYKKTDWVVIAPGNSALIFARSSSGTALPNCWSTTGCTPFTLLNIRSYWTEVQISTQSNHIIANEAFRTRMRYCTPYSNTKATYWVIAVVLCLSRGVRVPAEWLMADVILRHTEAMLIIN